LLDAMLATQPQAACDATFTHLREELRRFQGVEAAEQPAGFVGQLREYQREGLGWMHFLRRFRFGGCLADDMGVGKTAQVLALLETRRELRVQGELAGPWLVVVPKSLIFNWKQEAALFTPQLRILDYTGLSRNDTDLAAYDLVLTTYGTLRRDALRLQQVAFDYVVLDESQAVKNANTESAKAVRLLHGTNRLALSGTPIENHLGELWSLFEFLNPGMLGASSVMQLAGGALRNPDEDTRKLLARALRPFLLRRTKEQVARELPAKHEQTIYCEMEPGQHKLYAELRQHYRDSLLRRIQNEGLERSTILVLEALLRLRQAACHPGLLDPKHLELSSAKLDVLLEQLRVVLDERSRGLTRPFAPRLWSPSYSGECHLKSPEAIECVLDRVASSGESVNASVLSSTSEGGAVMSLQITIDGQSEAIVRAQLAQGNVRSSEELVERALQAILPSDSPSERRRSRPLRPWQIYTSYGTPSVLLASRSKI